MEIKMSRLGVETGQDANGIYIVNLPVSEMPDFNPVVETEKPHTHMFDLIDADNDSFDLLANANGQYSEVVDRVDRFKGMFQEAIGNRQQKETGQVILVKRDDIYTVELLTTGRNNLGHKEGVAFSIIDFEDEESGQRRIFAEMHIFTHADRHVNNHAHNPHPMNLHNFRLLEEAVELIAKRSNDNVVEGGSTEKVIGIKEGYKKVVANLGKTALSLR
ncbi:hypothetical protein DYH10_01230 [Candidatus Saccharibacteria bacterium CPR2]|nr:hypothetical protein [Candidatus Saccharibacteria bacterium CPR2]